MNPVVHFEMPSKNQKRVSKFYREAFGWEMQQMGSDFAEYVVATTTESDKKTGRPKEPGAINGGFFLTDPKKPAQVPSVVIGVANIKKHMQLVIKAGGKVLGEPVDIPGIGLYISILDTEGNRVSLLQAKR